MSALIAISNITKTTLVNEDLRYCLVDTRKRPFKVNNEIAAVNDLSNFVKLDELLNNDKLNEYSGVGISIQASKITAIDIDKCVESPFDVDSINGFAKEIIDMFKSFAYIEFSFSGTGIRILFRYDGVKNYSENYYIKNSKLQLEYYQHTMLGRYVTITGKHIYNNNLDIRGEDVKTIIKFLNKYMKRQTKLKYVDVEEVTDDRSIAQLVKVTKFQYMKSYDFQDVWFTHAPGSGRDESERDFRLVRFLYTLVTKDRNKVKELFEMSPFFKTKDSKHIYKWNQQDFKYFNYLFDNVQRRF